MLFSKSSQTVPPDLKWSSGRFLTMIVLAGIGTMALVGLVAVWAGAESDKAALDRQKVLVSARLHEQVERTRHDLIQIDTGYQALLSGLSGGVEELEPDVDRPLRAGRPGGHLAVEDKKSRAITKVALAIFGYDRAYVVDAGGELAMNADEETAKHYQWTRRLLLPLLQKILTRQPNGLPARDMTGADGKGAPGVDVVSSKTPALSSKSLAELLRLEGHPVVAGIVRLEASSMQPDAAAGHEPRYLVGVRFLDGNLLDDISREQGLSDARFARSADADEDEVAFQIDATATGDPIGFIVWNPDLPGSLVIKRLVPALSIAALVLTAIVCTLFARLSRTMIDLRASEFQARHLALHDVLTGLPNRALFASNLDAALRQGVSDRSSTLVVLVDLDYFKAVNDTFGHAAGDELICLAAARMAALIDPDATLARLGGDEFALVIRNPRGEPGMANDIGDSIVQALREPFQLRGGTVEARVGCSVGIAIASRTENDRGRLMRQADIALYEAKASGRGRWLLFSPHMGESRRDQDTLKSELQTAIANRLHDGSVDGIVASPERNAPSKGQVEHCGVLELYFQTLHRSASGHGIAGAEALVRWRHPRRGLMTPDTFVPFAEKNGLISGLGEWVLREACSVAASWPEAMYVAVNVSPLQLNDPNFTGTVMQILKDTGVDPERLELELTESVLLDDNPETAAVLVELRRRGIRIALDDFGTGCSSLSHLSRYQIDRIKIDRSFVRLLGTSANGAAIVQSIVGLGKGLNIATTAEGVETEAQRDFLSALGCDELQGYFFSRPMPRSAFERLLLSGVSAAHRSDAGRRLETYGVPTATG